MVNIFVAEVGTSLLIRVLFVIIVEIYALIID